jgi:hypothetical protein
MKEKSRFCNGNNERRMEAIVSKQNFKAIGDD